MAARALLLAMFLAACGATPARATTPAGEDAAVLRTLRTAHGDAAIVAVHVVAGTTFAVFAHDDDDAAPIAAEHVCRATVSAPLVVEPGCAHLAIARLAADGASIERAYELGAWCADRSPSVAIEIGDFDDDDRDEMSLALAGRAFVVLDLATFDVQFAGVGSDFAIEHPEGTGLYDTCYRARSEHHLDVGVDQSDYEFEDDLGQPADGLIREEGERPPDADCGTFRMRYDPSADCWRMPPPA